MTFRSPWKRDSSIMKPLFFFVFACFQTYIVAQDFEETFRTENARLVADIRQTRKEILEHSPSEFNPWEGEFIGNSGADTFTSIFVSAKHGLATLEHGIFGVHAGNCGVIEVKDSEMTVTLKYAEKHIGEFPKIFLIISWGDAYFLVPKGRVHGFCLRARRRDRTLLSSAFCLERLRPKTLQGLPSVPQKFQFCLSSDEIKTRIVNRKKATIEKLPNGLLKIMQTVSLDCGEQSGVYVGMEFESMRPNAVLTVSSLNKTECSATFESIEHPLSEISEGLEMGMVFGTALY